MTFRMRRHRQCTECGAMSDVELEHASWCSAGDGTEALPGSQAPRVLWRFATQHSETLEGALLRLDREYRATREKLLAPFKRKRKTRAGGAGKEPGPHTSPRKATRRAARLTKGKIG